MKILNYITLLERAATIKGYSKFIDKFGEIFYIGHRVDQGINEVICTAFFAANSPFAPLREKVGFVRCVMKGEIYSNNNNVPVYSDDTKVDALYRRRGLLSAMYNHLDYFGFVVYPADGSIGNKKLQSQSDDAKAFWKNRKETNNTIVSERDFYGWDNPFKNANEVFGLPVIEKIDISGYPNKLLVIWNKTFKSGKQNIGFMYDAERGYRVGIMLTDKEGYGIDDFPFYRDEITPLHFYNKFIEKNISETSKKAIVKLNQLIEKNKELYYSRF